MYQAASSLILLQFENRALGRFVLIGKTRARPVWVSSAKMRVRPAGGGRFKLQKKQRTYNRHIISQIKWTLVHQGQRLSVLF